MSRSSFVAAALALAGTTPLPVSLIAQEPVRPSDPRVEVRGRGPERAMQFLMGRRARLGLKVNLRARETDSVGAYVDAVTPNGPAANAGIRSGDVIVRVDNKSVLTGEAASRDDRESLPGLRLIELAAALEPNDTVPVEFRRGKEKKTVTVVTADEPTIVFRGQPGAAAFDFRYPAEGRGISPNGEDVFIGRSFLYGSPLANLELAPLNPDLGQYFGTTAGVLVISVPRDVQLGLKGGDVVLAVDGRKPESPSHLLRILRSYGDSETFKLDVLRNRKRVAVEGRLGAPSAD
ncbi:MAG TPA: PDZ domain-containing protein [Gemmatimonadales bacterium]|nr:PDZ domain-containing protein [Gemmatimonadales bacterium]